MFTEEERKRIVEELGKKVHELWMEKRRKEKGWHAPEECHTKQSTPGFELMQGPSDGKYCPDCHPCMVPYDQLPDSEKVLDRAYPMEFVKVLHGLGYTIARRPIPTDLPDIMLVSRECYIDGKKNCYIAARTDIAQQIVTGQIPIILLCGGYCAQEFKDRIRNDVQAKKELEKAQKLIAEDIKKKEAEKDGGTNTNETSGVEHSG